MTRSELADDAFCTVLDKLSDAFNRLSFGIFMYYDQSLPQFEQVTVEQDNGYARFAIFDRNFPDRVSWTCIRYHWADDRFEWFNYVAEGIRSYPTSRNIDVTSDEDWKWVNARGA